MNLSKKIKFYPPAEERINIISHAFGVIFGTIGLIALIIKATAYGNIWHIVSFSIFGSSLVILFAASTWYHSTKSINWRSHLRVVDHASIYIFIAGTYTPFALVTLHGIIGWTMFGIAWGIAIVGVTLKLFFTGRFSLISTLLYVFMGWMIVFAIKPLMANLPSEGLQWLVAGGLSYTIGAIFYSIKAIKFNHAIFHILVLLGSICHYISVYKYVLQ
ncbi:MAG: hemolysin III family protein [Gammaproteobacteria bacterium]|nr:hemolysin III family protein [Gammaproteobacteria bacterium]